MFEEKLVTNRCILCENIKFEALDFESKMINLSKNKRVYKCNKCNLSFIIQQNTDDENNESVYNQSYYTEYIAKCGMVGGNENISDYLKKRLFRMDNYINRGSLLEIGSAMGHFLNFARSIGWQVQGVELSKWAVEYSKKKYNLDVINGILEDAKFKNNSFDMIHMNHVFEHIPDPLSLMIEVKRILKKSGCFVIEIPNEFDNLYFQLRRFLKRPIEKYEIPSPHLFFYNFSTIKKLLKKMNFKIIKIRTFRNTWDISSNIPGGFIFKWIIFLLEKILRKGPLIEVIARPK